MLFLFVELTFKYGITFNTFNVRYLLRSIIIHTFAYVIKTFNDMKKYKVKDVLQMLKKDGWYLARTKGDHRHFKHPSKPGTVTIRGKESEVLNQFLLNSIWHQAGWK